MWKVWKRARRSSKQRSAPVRSGQASSTSQPASANTSTARAVLARIAGSIGRSPRLGENATRGVVAMRSVNASVVLITPRRRAMSATVLPIGPTIG